jgi:branched-subunit amino acid ABC-type transport system permease component
VGLDAGLPLWLACLLAVAAGGVFGVLLERFAVRPFTGGFASIGWMLTTIAVGIMIESLATMQFGGFSRPLPSPGVVIAGLAFGIMEKFVEGYISTAAREIIGFSAMILVLLAFPQGLFGKREVLKV